MKKIMVFLFLLLGCNAFSKDVSAKDVKVFKIDMAHVYVTSDIPVNEKSVITQVAEEFEGGFPGYKIISDANSGPGEDDKQTTADAGTTLTAAKGSGEDKTWHVNVEISSVGTVYPIAYSVRMSFEEFDRINSTVTGVCIQNNFDSSMTEAIGALAKALALKFYKLKEYYK